MKNFGRNSFSATNAASYFAQAGACRSSGFATGQIVEFEKIPPATKASSEQFRDLAFQNNLGKVRNR
jgi:hypothetical protein